MNIKINCLNCMQILATFIEGRLSCKHGAQNLDNLIQRGNQPKRC
ncbi:hypothetical protein FBY09_1508 [Pseudomonas sp. SJZ101]|nr:hypothetical protein FBY00_15116 [Pseudomonas sp. SJZ075]TWC26636.1 hypothetical protein FBY02_15016 [Pseudomonas sp. SJZ078]TWC45357.1 hypothetical protein FBY11_1527 [Pseudomonas sp. SJZ124]TWC80438.1 hypothetical protein FBY09_1508 [Pseudomonas sp. SJZ101]